jgi:hypothetical protein
MRSKDGSLAQPHTLKPGEEMATGRQARFSMARNHAQQDSRRYRHHSRRLMTLACLVGASHDSASAGDAAYSAGQVAGQWLAHILGVVILVGGVRCLFKNTRPTA